jgi:transaldolase
MTALKPARSGAEPLARQHHPRILDNGTLRRYIDELSVTGLTSNPTIFDEAIGGGSAYDASIQQKAKAGLSARLFVELALEDLRRAADLFRPVHDRTAGLDGWVSMEVSPLLADDTKATIEAARRIHKLADRPNLYVKIPGHPAGASAIEEAIFAGVPVNVTLLFSREQYLVVAEAYYARHRAAHRRRTRSARELGCLAVRQPLGSGRRDKVPQELPIGWG